jgi:hypothetical protein
MGNNFFFNSNKNPLTLQQHPSRPPAKEKLKAVSTKKVLLLPFFSLSLLLFAPLVVGLLLTTKGKEGYCV